MAAGLHTEKRGHQLLLPSDRITRGRTDDFANVKCEFDLGALRQVDKGEKKRDPAPDQIAIIFSFLSEIQLCRALAASVEDWIELTTR
jgi:hypothetical protein